MKGCHECKHLDLEHGDEWGSGAGWYCEKREPGSIKEENILLANMAREAYRNRYKRCFEPVGADKESK